MNIVFIHYHLKPGGVTTVIEQQINVLKKDHSLLVLTGVLPPSNFPCDIEQIPSLGYSSELNKKVVPEKTAADIIERIESRWKTSGCDVIHVHNPTLAKNKHFLRILKELQKCKINLFLQIHDFAEDGRPQSYFNDDYPINCHYGVINSRDYSILQNAGLKKAGLHKICNIVKPFKTVSNHSKIKNAVLYPMRAIRRKNIGEAILLSLFLKEDDTLVITLPPNSPVDIPSYHNWKNFVKDKKLNVVFDAGLQHDFETLVLSSRFIITTSINEGFGFSFLEPWTAGKFLWGRKLPDICRDFEKNDINLDHLYSRIDIPIAWVGRKRLFHQWKTNVQAISQRFGMPFHDAKAMDIFLRLTQNDLVDFGLLHEVFQEQVLSRVLPSPQNRKILTHLNPVLKTPGKVPHRQSLITHNRRAVLAHYHKKRYRRELIDIYNKVIQRRITHRIDKKRLLSHFMTPRNLSLLKWSRYPES